MKRYIYFAASPLRNFATSLYNISMQLSRFETVAQQVLEGSFKRLFGGYLEPQEVASRLARAMEDGIDDALSPDLFTVALHPRDYEHLCQQSGLETELAAYITRLVRQLGLGLAQRPLIRLISDKKAAQNRPRITAVFQDSHHRQITELHSVPVVQEEIIDAVMGLSAFLVVNGRKTYPIQKPIITVGRRNKNDIVLPVAAVSRRHVQLRWRYGRFILYDLTNRGRTAVNGIKVSEWPLQSGDVINISGQTLIYGEDTKDMSH